MRSSLRDIAAQLRSASYDVFLAWLALAAFTVGGCTAHGVEPEAQARAALAIAKAKRERAALACFNDLESAAAEAKRSHKPLVLWIGLRCVDRPALRRELADAVHCHLPERHGDATPRIAIEDAMSREWFVRAEKIEPDTARKLRGKWIEGRLLRDDVGIREE